MKSLQLEVLNVKGRGLISFSPVLSAQPGPFKEDPRTNETKEVQCCWQGGPIREMGYIDQSRSGLDCTHRPRLMVGTTFSHESNPFTYLELAHLDVHRKGVKFHWTNEGDPRGQGVHKLVLVINPDSFQLGQDRMGLKLFQIEDLHVWQPKIAKNGNINGCQFGSLFGQWRGVKDLSTDWGRHSGTSGGFAFG